MNKKYNLKGCTSGLWFVLGKGFTASTQCGASALTLDQVAQAKALGFEPATTVEVKVKSFAVNYIRPGDIDTSGKVKANAYNPSARRFATFDEAFQHGTQLQKRDASKGHLGFYVTESSDSVNASINWKTGLTNSL